MSSILKLARCVGVLVLFAAGAHAGTVTLTGIAVFGGDSTGLLGTGGWNTACNSPVAQLAIAGYATCPLSVDISTPGVYTFDYSAQGSVGDEFADLELFFNGQTLTPGIHAVIDRDSSSNPPPLSAATAATQQCLYYNSFSASCSPAPLGPGSLTFSAGGETVTLLEFTATQSWTGEIQLLVGGGVPEPGTAQLLGLGFFALLVIRPCRR